MSAPKAIRALVCGGRDLDSTQVWNWLERFGHQDAGGRITVLIHGGARGADQGAAEWGESEGIKVMAFPADWKKHGKAAGPLRNRKMLVEGKPDVVIAFPGGKGTANMVALAREAGIPVVDATPLAASPLPSSQWRAA